MTYITAAAYKNILAVSTTHTSVQNAGAWGQTDAIDGSTVTYEPVSSSSKIIYKISFYADSQSRTNMYSIAIQESTNSGASWTTINNAYNRMFGMASTGVPTGQDQRWYMNCQFIIPSWSGSRMLRVIICVYTCSSNDSYKHRHRLSNSETQKRQDAKQIRQS